MIDNLIYLSRYAFWNNPTIRDFKRFPTARIEKGSRVSVLGREDKEWMNPPELFKNLEYRYRKETYRSSLKDLLISTETTSFIIVKDGNILFEEYFNDYSRNSVNTSFSVAKSFTSALVGIAIDEGHIGSINDRVIDYIPELKVKVSQDLTLKHLLMMSSGLYYNSSLYPWSDEPASYYYPDIQRLVLKRTKQEDEPGRYFKYVNYNTILLGIILNRSTGMLPYAYLQEKIWKPLGMEFEASWNLDSRKTDFPKMESGINAGSIDFVRFGMLFLNNGKWGERQIIPEKWVRESSEPFAPKDSDYYTGRNFYPYTMFFNDKNLYYKYCWWGIRSNDGSYDYTAIGVLGQFIYISPRKKILIVRNGKRWGKISWWPGLFRSIVEQI
ncbi:MAG TPA: serine hydrolase [Bacteroidales bacterium]|nr:serine hydrolase [Bacteroidales bacterium]